MIKRIAYLTGLFLIIGFSVVSIFRLYSVKTLDGDVYFHLAYGRQAVEKSVFSIDENAYRWSGINIHLYPAWLFQSIVYLLEKNFGFNSIYILRFFLLIGLYFLSLIFYKKLQIDSPYIFFSMLFAVFILAKSVFMLKADMFSGFFFFLFVYIYFYAKMFENYRILIWLPLLTVLWVNSHISVMVGIGFIGLAFISELLFFRDKRLYIWLAISLLLSVLGLFIVPDPGYVIDIIKGLIFHIVKLASFGECKQFFERYILAYQSISFSLENLFVWVLVVMFSIYTLLLIRYANIKIEQSRVNKKIQYLQFIPWWQLILLLPFLRMFFLFSRLVYYVGPVLFFCMLWILKQTQYPRGIRKEFVSALYGVLVIFSILTTYKAYITNSFGFGHGLWVPVKDARYIKRYIPNKYKILNSYGQGSYLMWFLGPDYKIFMDSRAGSNFAQYISLIKTLHLGDKLQEYKLDFDVALISYKDLRLLKQVYDMEDMDIGFYDTSGVVFLRKDIDAPRFCPRQDFIPELKKRAKEIRDYKYKQKMFAFFVYSGLLDEAESLLNIVGDKETHFIIEAERSVFPPDVYLKRLDDIKKLDASIKSALLDLWRKREAEALSNSQVYEAMVYEDLCSRLESTKYIWRHLYNEAVLHSSLLAINGIPSPSKTIKAYVSAVLDICKRDTEKGICSAEFVEKLEEVLKESSLPKEILKR